MKSILLAAVIVLPFLAGALLTLFRFGEKRSARCAYVAVVTVLEFIGVLLLCIGEPAELFLGAITDQITIRFRVDGISRIFTLVCAGLWVPVAFYSFTYMKHEGAEDRFYTFFLLSEGALIGMDFSANLVCMYVLYEMMTLAALPLILHSLKKEAIDAAMKYLFYSIAGAFMALMAILVLSRYCATLDFQAGGSLAAGVFAEHKNLILVTVFLACLGLGAKAGMYPLHGWLPAAHPVAPAPASAVLSAVIAKAGVLGIVRILYFVVGPETLRGSWVQYALLSLAMLTVFMGSMMAFREKVFKKRLAYSTVSQISYVLIGVFLLTGEGLLGGLLHVIFHATIKTCLFLVAGSVIYNTGFTRVDEVKGLGKRMPITFWGYTLASLALIGIPPASGFVSKWYLATASLASGTGVVTWLAPVILLISALLTAGYLLPLTIDGFFPGKDYDYKQEKIEKSAWMWLPIAILSALTLLMGICSGGLVEALSALTGSLV